jgi:hypothetical protein
MAPNIQELTGSLKGFSDLSSESVRIRYSDAQNISGTSGQRILMRFPKIQGKFLNLSTIFFNLTLNLTGSDTQLDAYSISSLFSRVRVLSSSNVLCDIQDFNLLSTILAQAQTNVSMLNAQTRGNRGLFASSTEAKTAAAVAGKRYSFQFPEGILNTSCLLPLYKLSGYFQVELYLADGKKVLSSATNNASAAYSVSDVQILCEYLSSPSLVQFYDSNPLSFHIPNYSHRYQTTADARSVLRMPSSVTSLSKIIIVFRNQSVVDSTTSLNVADRAQSMVPYSDIIDFQLFCNQQPFFSEAITYTGVELWNETQKAIPGIENSSYFTNANLSQQVGGSGPLAISLVSAPQKFVDAIISGIKTSSHSSDIYANIGWRAASSFSTYAATVFLVNDSKIFVDNNNSLCMEF